MVIALALLGVGRVAFALDVPVPARRLVVIDNPLGTPGPCCLETASCFMDLSGGIECAAGGRTLVPNAVCQDHAGTATCL